MLVKAKDAGPSPTTKASGAKSAHRSASNDVLPSADSPNGGIHTVAGSVRAPCEGHDVGTKELCPTCYLRQT